MKAFHLISAALVTTTVWAESPRIRPATGKSLGLFIKQRNGFVPFGVGYYDAKKTTIASFSPEFPTEVYYETDDDNRRFVRTSDGTLGFVESKLFHGPEVPKVDWQLLDDNSVANLDIFLCPSEYTYVSTEMREGCNPTKMYILYFNDDTGVPDPKDKVSVEKYVEPAAKPSSAQGDEAPHNEEIAGKQDKPTASENATEVAKAPPDNVQVAGKENNLTTSGEANKKDEVPPVSGQGAGKQNNLTTSGEANKKDEVPPDNEEMAGKQNNLTASGKTTKDEQNSSESSGPFSIIITADGRSLPLILSADADAFLWGIHSLKAHQFYYQGDQIVTKDAPTKYVGFDSDMLGYIAPNSDNALMVDQSTGISSQTVALCQFESSLIHTIHNTPRDGCYEGKIHIERLNKTLGSESKATSKDDENPLVFIAKHGNESFALTSDPDFMYYNALSYGYPLPPVELDISDSYASPKNTIFEGFAGFQLDIFGFGKLSDYDKFKLEVDKKGKLQGANFKSCERPDSAVHDIVRNGLPERNCFDIEIFVAAYNRKTGQFHEIDGLSDGKVSGGAKDDSIFDEEDRQANVPEEAKVPGEVKSPEEASPKEDAKAKDTPKTESGVNKKPQEKDDSAKVRNGDGEKKEPKENSKPKPEESGKSKPSKDFKDESISESAAKSPHVNGSEGSGFNNSETNSTASSISNGSRSSLRANSSSQSTSHFLTGSSVYHVNRTRIVNSSHSFNSTQKSESDCIECHHEAASDASGKKKPKKNAKSNKEPTAPTSVCTECETVKSVVWNTRIDYTTYISSTTTVTISKCDESCHPSTVIVTTPTTFTCPGVCIIPETLSVNETPSLAVMGGGGAQGATETGAATKTQKAAKETKEGVPSHESNQDKSKPNDKQSVPSHIADESCDDTNETSENSSSDQKGVVSAEAAPEALRQDKGVKFENEGGSPLSRGPKGKSDTPKKPSQNKKLDSIKSLAGGKNGTVSDLTSTNPKVTPFVNGASRNAVGSMLFGLIALVM